MARAHEGVDVPEQRHGRELEQLELQLAGLDLREVEDVVDDGEQVLAVPAHDHRVVEAVALAERGRREHVREAEQRRQRRADLVAHLREEAALGDRRGLGGGFRLEQAFLRLVELLGEHVQRQREGVERAVAANGRAPREVERGDREDRLEHLLEVRRLRGALGALVGDRLLDARHGRAEPLARRAHGAGRRVARPLAQQGVDLGPQRADALLERHQRRVVAHWCTSHA
jgi:hypothetical protein